MTKAIKHEAEVIYKFKEDQQTNTARCMTKKDAEMMVIQMKSNPLIEFAIINDKV